MGPENPYKTQQMRAVKNTVTGFAEPSHVSQFQFETQRRTFHSYGMFQFATTLSCWLARCLVFRMRV